MSENNGSNLYIPSVEALVSLIVESYAKNDMGRQREIIQYLENTQVIEHIAGTADEFHNASVTLSRIGYYDLAYGILEKIVEMRYSKSTDLLGDLLCYGMKCRNLDELYKWYERLNVIPKRFWTWRAYQFSFDYLMETLPYIDSEDELTECERKLEDLFKTFKDNFRFIKDKSDCEKAYMMENVYYRYQGDEEKANKALSNAVVELQGKCAQCALNYADLMFSAGDYDKAAEYAQIAVGIKEDQLSINLGYAYYILAMSLETKVRNDKALTMEARIRPVYNAYFSAYLHMENSNKELRPAINKQVITLERDSGIDSNIDFDELDAHGLSRKEFGKFLGAIVRNAQGTDDDDD